MDELCVPIEIVLDFSPRMPLGVEWTLLAQISGLQNKSNRGKICSIRLWYWLQPWCDSDPSWPSPQPLLPNDGGPLPHLLFKGWKWFKTTLLTACSVFACMSVEPCGVLFWVVHVFSDAKSKRNYYCTGKVKLPPKLARTDRTSSTKASKLPWNSLTCACIRSLITSRTWIQRGSTNQTPLSQ